MKLKRDVRETRKKYLLYAIRLRELSAPCGFEKQTQIEKMRKDQRVLYEKWRFYDGIIKTNEKINKRCNQENQ